VSTVASSVATESETRQGWTYVGRLGGAALALLLCFALLKFMGEHKLAPVNSGVSGLLNGPKVDLLFVGSSHTRLSYDMKIIERSTGDENSYLCAYNDADLRTIAQLLEYVSRDPDHKPKFVAVEAYSFILAQKPDLQDPRLYFDAPPELKLRVLSDYFEARRNFSAVLDLFDLTVNRGNDQILAYPIYAWMERTASYKGGRRDIVAPGVSPEQFRSFKVEKHIGDPDPIQVESFHRIAALARSKSIHIIFIESPMPAPVSANPGIQRIKQSLRKLAESEGCIYIDGDAGFPIGEPELFTDNNHLSAAGKQLFSERIGPLLKDWMGQFSG
jgi:hypothetical protein